MSPLHNIIIAPDGPCARMNYQPCCPPGDGCLADDDNGEECSCSSDCYVFEDCCDDVGCPESNMIMHTYNIMIYYGAAIHLDQLRFRLYWMLAIILYV